MFVAPRTEEGWLEQIRAAMCNKKTAAADSRAYRLRRLRQQRTLLAVQRESPAPPAPAAWPETPEQRGQVRRWRRQRQFVLLVAEDPTSGELLGTAALTLAQPEAVLPAPFPTNKPLRVYCRWVGG